MQTVALYDVSSEGQELRYLTAHFRDLQGLRMAPLWLTLLVLTSLAKTGSYSGELLARSAGILIVAEFGWLYLVGRWYDRRYGVVKEPERRIPSGLISILHPEVPPQYPANPLARRYGDFARVNAVIFLSLVIQIVPSIFVGHGFVGHRPRYWELILIVLYCQFLPRAFYPVTHNWSVLLRRIFAVAATIATIGIYLNFYFVGMNVWTWMTLMLCIPLLLDLYDHWLLHHLLSSDFTEGSHG